VHFSQTQLNFGINYLKDLIHECKRKKIEIILVHAPLYYELLQLIPQQDLFIQQVTELASKNAIQFWDYSQDSVSFSKEYFYNSQHLNISGAEIFSEHLAKDLKQYVQNKYHASKSDD
ncbi:MAG TPA: hypothetical protein VLM39_13800, partial [Ignavibacteriaceae bacterium]|nr:hypothetical protein [Ignavibacteriaceae bacterium]